MNYCFLKQLLTFRSRGDVPNVRTKTNGLEVYLHLKTKKINLHLKNKMHKRGLYIDELTQL